jgi:hypothetical protein
MVRPCTQGRSNRSLDTTYVSLESTLNYFDTMYVSLESTLNYSTSNVSDIWRTLLLSPMTAMIVSIAFVCIISPRLSHTTRHDSTEPRMSLITS